MKLHNKYIFLTIVIVTTYLYSQKTTYNTKIISDNYFTNCTFSLFTFQQAYSCYLTYEQSKYIYETAKKHRINPIIIMVTADKESSTFGRTPTRQLDDYFLGAYKHFDKKHLYSGFYSQVNIACKSFSNNFYNHSVYYGNKCYIAETGEWQTVANKATFALYRYTPRWKQRIYGGLHGNFNVPNLIEKHESLINAY